MRGGAIERPHDEDTPAGTSLPVSVVIPTIGRAELLQACLGSVAACEPRAAEIVVVDQSSDPAVRSVVEGFAGAGAQLLISTIRDRSVAVNHGMREARHEIILVTDDDCTVDPDWLEAVARQGDGIAEARPLALPEKASEAMLMGLRLAEGLDLAALARRFRLAEVALCDPAKLT